MEQKNKKLKIICPFCNAPYTAEMEEDLFLTGGCPTCDYKDYSGTIDIICNNCKKIVYSKEISI